MIGSRLKQFRIVEKIEERAAARGMKEFTDLRGNQRSLEGLVARVTHSGALRDEEKRFDEVGISIPFPQQDVYIHNVPAD